MGHAEVESAVDLLYNINSDFLFKYIAVLSPMLVIPLIIIMIECPILQRIPRVPVSYLLGILVGGGSILALKIETVDVAMFDAVLEIGFVIYLTDAAYSCTDSLMVSQSLSTVLFAAMTHTATTLTTWLMLWQFEKNEKHSDPSKGTTQWLQGEWYLLAVALDCLDHKRSAKILSTTDDEVQGFAVGEAVISTTMAITNLFVYQSTMAHTPKDQTETDTRGFGLIFDTENALLYIQVFAYHWIAQILLGITYGIFSVRLASWHKSRSSDSAARTPSLYLGMQFLAYYNSRLYNMGGALTLLISGVIQRSYGKTNLSEDAEVLIKAFTSSAVDILESALTVIIGMEATVFALQQNWWQKPVVLGVVCVTLFRMLIVLWLGLFFHKFLFSKTIQLQDLFLMAVAPTRGIVMYLMSMRLIDGYIFCGIKYQGNSDAHKIITYATVYFSLLHVPLVRILSGFANKLSSHDDNETATRYVLRWSAEHVMESTGTGMRAIAGDLTFKDRLETLLARLHHGFLSPFMRNDHSEQKPLWCPKAQAVDDRKLNILLTHHCQNNQPADARSTTSLASKKTQ